MMGYGKTQKIQTLLLLLFILEIHRKNQTVHGKSIKERALAVEKWESVNASTQSLTIASSL